MYSVRRTYLLDRFVKLLTALQFRYWQPLHYPARWSQRKSQEFTPTSDSLSALSICLGQVGACRHETCVRLIHRNETYYQKFRNFDSELSKNSKRFRYPRPTLHAIALTKYSHYAEYQKEMRRDSGNFMREAVRSKRSGYYSQELRLENYTPDMLAIHRSAKVRSFGVFFDAFLLRLDHLGGPPQRYVEIEPPQCTQHWEKVLGVFLPQRGYHQGMLQTDQQLVGYARLHRIGNTVMVRDFIGHAEHVKNGVLKLLHLHMLEWLLERFDPLVLGVDQITYGTVENGSDGLYFWKKKALFKPFFATVELQSLPPDFNATQYLRLNPDLEGLAIHLETHYLWNGRAEGRLYKINVPEDFDSIQYLSLNPDLPFGVSEADLHYTRHGQREKRPYRHTSAHAQSVAGGAQI